MKVSVCKNYDDLPLFLNANLVAQVLGVSISTAYEVMHEPSFPTLRVGSRMVPVCGGALQVSSCEIGYTVAAR